MTKDKKPTTQDILEAMNVFSTHMDEEFASVRSEMVTKDEFNYQIERINDELSGINGRLTQVVTKDYLDDKLSDLRGEFFLKTGLAKKRAA